MAPTKIRFTTDASPIRPQQQHIITDSPPSTPLKFVKKKTRKFIHISFTSKFFYATKNIDDAVTIITSDKIRITHSKEIPSGAEYESTFPDIRTYDISKRVCLTFKLESTHMLSQLKYESKENKASGIFDTLRKKMAFLKTNNVRSQTEASMRFFLEITPKIILKNSLRKKLTKHAPG